MRRGGLALKRKDQEPDWGTDSSQDDANKR